MFSLPDTFKEKNEDYIVVNAMKNFIKCRPNMKCKLRENRAELIKSITDYANKSDVAREETLNWIDSVVREGIKDLYIMKLTDESKALVEDAVKLNAEFTIQRSIQYIVNLLGLSYSGTQEIGWYFKNRLYRLLDKYTNTPKEIETLMEQSNGEIKSAIEIIADKICMKGNRDDITSDIMNLIEKYFSITYEDKSIFIKGKDAYPLRIAATDEEESKVDQRSAREHPLQSKALFFDNKKMMQKNQICDGAVFKFRRKSKRYYEDEFKVRITIKNNYCHIKFFEYTEEVDIQNVLRLFIGS